MKLYIDIQLGNEAMQTAAEVKTAIGLSFTKYGRETGSMFEPLKAADEGIVVDANGNAVGRWDVLASDSDVVIDPSQQELYERAHEANVQRIKLIITSTETMRRSGEKASTLRERDAFVQGLRRSLAVLDGKG